MSLRLVESILQLQRESIDANCEGQQRLGLDTYIYICNSRKVIWDEVKRVLSLG